MIDLDEILDSLPESEAAPVGQCIRHRVRGRTFLYSNPEATRLILKLDLEEAHAVTSAALHIEPWDNNLGKDHGWVVVRAEDLDESQCIEVAEMIETSYALVAPKSLL